MEQIIIFTVSLPSSSSKYQHDSGLVSQEKKCAIDRIYYALAFYRTLLDAMKNLFHVVKDLNFSFHSVV